MSGSFHHLLLLSLLLHSFRWPFVAALAALGFCIDCSQSMKVPFRINDVFPMLLPREISWPVLNNFHSAVDLLPYYVGSVSPNNGTLECKRACFYGNQDITEGDCDDPGLAGGVLYLTVKQHGVSVFLAVSRPSSDV